MTGFGAAAGEERAWTLRVELRSVNHRYLMVKTRLPGELAWLEPEVDALVRKGLERGSVTVFVHAAREERAEPAELNPAVAKRYLQDIRRLQSQLGVDGEVGIETLLGLPGVVGGRNGGDPRKDQARLGKRVLKLVRDATKALVEMRETEGAALRKDLEKHAAASERIVGHIEGRMPKVVREHNAGLQARIQDLLGREHTVEPAALAREAALISDRLDVSEEVSRLRIHLDQVLAILAKGGAVGRRLDFLVQELHREVNTIGSKCSDAKVAHWVVDLKTHVERLREQVQNVE
jgi:uncharacterized protein (TIGR00255 family)